VLLELLVAKQRTLVVGGVVHGPAPPLRAGGTNAQPHDELKGESLFFHRIFIFSFAILDCGKLIISSNRQSHG